MYNTFLSTVSEYHSIYVRVIDILIGTCEVNEVGLGKSLLCDIIEYSYYLMVITIMLVYLRRSRTHVYVHMTMVSPSQTSMTLSLGWHVPAEVWQLITFVFGPKHATLTAPPLPLGPLITNVSSAVENQLETSAKPNSEQAIVAAWLLHSEAQGAAHFPLYHISNCPTLGWGPPSNRRSPTKRNRKMTPHKCSICTYVHVFKVSCVFPFNISGARCYCEGCITNVQY